MPSELSRNDPAKRPDRTGIGIVATVALALLLSSFLAGVAGAYGQPDLGFPEASAGEQFQVMGLDWSVRTDLRFGTTETVRVNVTSSTVDWIGNAGGGGTQDLELRRYDGTVLAPATFTETIVGPLFAYTASIDLMPLALAADAYYLRIFIDDTVNTFEATSEIQVGPGFGPHYVETYTDDTFTRASDVFTTTSLIWVKVIGRPDQGGDRWDLAEFVNANSAVGGPRGGFDNFRRAGSEYTFSVDLANFPGLFVQRWSYTLSVRLTNAAFDAGKQLQVFDPSVSVSWTDIAPATAAQGQTDVPMLALRLSLNANWATSLGPASFNLERIRLTLTGSGAGTDIAGIHIWGDTNGNGALDSGDVRLASIASVGGVGFPAWVGTNGVTTTTLDSSGPRALLVTYDIAPTATVGSTVGARIPAVADIDMAGHMALITGLPAQSSNVRITAASVLTVTNDPGIAPGAAARGQTVVPIDLLHFASNGAIITLNNLSVDLVGTGGPSDVARVALYIDNGDGAFNPATDPLLGTSAAFPPTGSAVFRNLALQVDATGRDVWIVFDIAASATIGDDVGTRIASAASVEVSGGTVFPGTFPLDSGLTTIRGPALTVTPLDLVPAQARQGRQNVPMLRLTLSVDLGQTTVTGFRMDKRGTSTSDADVSLAKIWLDDGDGLFDLGDTLLGQQAFVGGTTVIGGFSLVVMSGANRVVFVTFDIAPAATLGVTVSARLGTSAYVSVDPNSTVSGANFAIVSSPTMIVAPGSGAFLTVGSIDLAGTTPSAYRGQKDVGLEKLLLTVDANQATVSGFRVDRRGTGADSDIAAVKLYRDANGNGALDSGDALLVSTTFVAGTAIFGGLSLVVTPTQPVTLFIAVDIASGATINATVGVRLSNENYVAADANTTVDPNSFPIASSFVTITAAQPPGGPGPESFFLTAVAVGLGVLAALGILLAVMRRRNRCPICGKPKDRNRAVCPECEAKGLGPRGQAMPPTPPPPPPSG